jgi:hypothetical protein
MSQVSLRKNSSAVNDRTWVAKIADVTRYFTATINASWSNGVGTLAERFQFNDGEIQFRTWTLTPTTSSSYLAAAHDVVEAGTARTTGNVLQLDYVLAATYRGREIHLDGEDWMCRVDAKPSLTIRLT